MVVVWLFEGMFTVQGWQRQTASGYNPGKTSFLTEEVGIAFLVFAVYRGVDFSILRSIPVYDARNGGSHRWKLVMVQGLAETLKIDYNQKLRYCCLR